MVNHLTTGSKVGGDCESVRYGAIDLYMIMPFQVACQFYKKGGIKWKNIVSRNG